MQAARRGEQVALVGEDHRHPLGAVSEAEQVVERPHPLPRPSRRRDRPVVPHLLPVGPGGESEPRRRPGRHGDEGNVPGPVHRHVEGGPVPLDLAEFTETGREFAGDVVPLDVVGGMQDPGGFVVREPGPEVGEQPGAEPFGLADVHDPAGRVGHPVDRGAVFRQRPDAQLERVEVGRGQRQGDRGRHSDGQVDETVGRSDGPSVRLSVCPSYFWHR